MIELRPCPFCGGEAKIESGAYTTPMSETFYKARVVCQECGAWGMGFEREIYDREDTARKLCESDAVRFWNRRANDENNT